MSESLCAWPPVTMTAEEFRSAHPAHEVEPYRARSVDGVVTGLLCISCGIQYVERVLCVVAPTNKKEEEPK